MYFKKIDLNHVNATTLERSLRKVTSKRLSPLDFNSSVTDGKEQMLFLGYEKTNELQFTRIKYPFELLLPELIVSVAKSKQPTASYKIRLGLGSILIIGIILASSIYGLYQLALGEAFVKNMSRIFIFPALFFLLLKVELKLTQKNITKALEQQVV